MVNEANVVVQKKIAVAVEDKGDAFTKTMVARRAVELANFSLGFVAVDKGSEGGGSVIDEDAQLAMQLHRVMNRSRGIARNPYVLNTNCVDVSKLNTDANFDVFQPQAVVETSSFSKPTVVAGDVTSVDTDLLKRELNGRLAETKPDCLQKSSGAEDEKCIDHSNGYLITYSRRGQRPQDESCKKEPDCVLRMYSRRQSRVEGAMQSPDDCFKTYSGRPSAASCCNNKLLYGSFDLELGILAPAIALNSSIE